MIGEVGPEAIDGIMEVMEQAFDGGFGEAWNRGQCLGILGLPGVWMTLERDDDGARGFALARVTLDEAELLLIAVKPAFRGQGVGARLLDEVIRSAARRGASRIHLEVRDGNDALRLYSSSGFQQVGRRRGYYTGSHGQTYDALTLMRSTNDPGGPKRDNGQGCV